MSKIPFDIKYRPQIESGEYRVETREGLPVRIICWNRIGVAYPIVALVPKNSNEEIQTYTEDGTFYKNVNSEARDLLIIAPDEELTEFESNVRTCITENLTTHTKDGSGVEISSTVFIDDDTTKKLASELFSLVREQVDKDGYIIEKKAFHDAVEKVDSGVIKDVSAHIDFENLIHNLGKRYPEVSFAKLARIAKVAYQKGMEEALKDLPRWEKLIHPTVGPVALIKTWNGGYRIDNHMEPGDSFIPLSMLETLPGFKEEDCHE